jgi:hypothetical protein
MKNYYLLTVLLVVSGCASLKVVRSSSGNREPSTAGWSETEIMNLERLKLAAFSSCQIKFMKPTIEPVPDLDPPHAGGRDAQGMVYQEELEVKTTNLLDRDGFYFSPRPRAAVNSLPMEIFVDNDNSGLYRRKTWTDANPDFSSALIQPPIDKNALPAAARVLTELIIGHRSPQGDYPQLFDIRSSAYVRFAGYPPQATGASLRLGAHRIFGLTGGQSAGPTVPEDFPTVRSLFISAPDSKTARAYVNLESDLFCGALRIEMIEGSNAEMVVDSYWYTRRDFDWKNDRHTGFVAYSSMMFKSEKQTPNVSTDEAHDSDTLIIKDSRGVQKQIPIELPPSGLQIRDFTDNPGQARVVEWSLANLDRDPAHYSDFKPALGNTNYDLRASYKVTILASSHKTGVSLYVHSPDGEYGDNIVAVSTIRQDIKKAKTVDDFVRFKYKTSSFYP